MEMIPIFIITCDRLEMLKKSIESYYACIETPFKIVICDQGSTFKPMVRYLKFLGSNGMVEVYWRGKVNAGQKRNLARDNGMIAEVVEKYFKGKPKTNYIVTDPDIMLDNANSDILELYSKILDFMPSVDVVGPMLRIDDIPDYYPLKKKLLNNSKHRKFHMSTVHLFAYKGTWVKYIFAKIDTTFGMYRAGAPWGRLKQGVRTFKPYWAKHLDWYVDPANLTDDQKYYMHRASRNAHWSKWC